MTDASPASLPYHEPDIITILVQSSFLLLLNVVNYVLDKILYCGLLGQVLLGVAFGAPGAKWLSTEAQEVIVQLGYIGLILLVYEGGLSTSFSALKANLALSTAVAITGIGVPIGLSFSLPGLVGATPLQAFAAGAALCSTSLGTTFTVLSTSGLTTTRLGVVLTSAAMMDDVVGLVMVQVISNLGGSSTAISAVTVVRPVLVSLAFAAAIPLVCRFIVKPFTVWLNGRCQSNPSVLLSKILARTQTAFLMHTFLLVALVSAASYAGTSNLFAAYLAGAAIGWWDEEVPHLSVRSTYNSGSQTGGLNPKTSLPADISSNRSNVEPQAPPTTSTPEGEQYFSTNAADRPTTEHASGKHSGTAIYEAYYQQPVNRILKPLFFASIGFSIPITRMFTGSVVWRGIVYTTLMAFGKLLCGIWLIRLSLPPGQSSKPPTPSSSSARSSTTAAAPPEPPPSTELTTLPSASSTSPAPPPAAPDPPPQTQPLRSAHPKKPRSLYPASILGCAMVARGEIGFLISSIAETNGVFASRSRVRGDADEIFLVVTWAIVLCTVVGPLCVGLLVRRVKRLEGKREDGRGDVLGVWGVR